MSLLKNISPVMDALVYIQVRYRGGIGTGTMQFPLITLRQEIGSESPHRAW
jgi:hypothetical protein